MEPYKQAFDLHRFVQAQERDFSLALGEIRAGKKQSHWMWYIFPQLLGLGQSFYAQYFGIPGIAEARAYLDHPYLRGNLVTISRALLELEETNPEKILGFPDNRKLQSSMTLFEAAAPEEGVFSQVLEKFFRGQRDSYTLTQIGKQDGTEGWT